VEEQNPLVGLRGVRRYFADKKHFCEELCVVKDVANVNDNVKLLVPFVQDAREFTKVFQMCKEAGWKGEIGSMIEIPSALLTAKEFVQAGATNLFVGLNDLTSLFLGRDRGDPSLKLHPALWHQISALSEAIGPSAKWGIGGNMSSEIVKTARASGAGYVSMHYDEVSKLMGIDPARTPDIGLVRTIKDHTNKLKKAYALQATHS
jgi:phosphoenolpyruvate-protein kinase (PTS system EI component)